jgi:nucleoside-diphosphate-sugar epimerase
MAKRYVITGGGGFVGKALGKALRAEGHEVLSLARGSYPELAQFGIKTAQVDIAAPLGQWQELLRGYDGVFHTAAKVDMWGKREDFYRTNVVGTRNIVDACRALGIQNLVFTSSPSVIHDGRDLEGVDESYPYPKHFDAHYPETKAIAEQEVLAANNGTNLKTVALRPHLIWGPEDTNLIPTVLERGRAGKLKQIGDGLNRVDLTFIDDCVQAHILAMRALEQNDSNVCGKVYFISQGDPVPMWGWINQVLSKHGVPTVTRSIPKGVALVVARILEGIATVMGWCGVSFKPLLTRFLVSEMSTHHYFSIEAAKRDLGYKPSCTIEQAMERTFAGRLAA